MSVDGGPEYPATTDLADVATGGVALVDEPIAFDVEAIRGDFPILERTVDGAPAGLSRQCQQLPEAAGGRGGYRRSLPQPQRERCSRHACAGGRSDRGVRGFARATSEFIGANRSEEVVFTKNASEALNLCAYTLGTSIRPGDEIVISVMEHHSNIVPWQLLAQRSGAVLRWFDVTNQGRLDLDKAAAEGLINERTKIISVAYVSNVLGTVNPISQIAALGHAVGATVVVDASQAVPQLAVDFAALGADLVAFTGHKMVGPTGIGVLWGRYELLAALPPFLGGGEMIEIVTMEGSTYAPPPHRFEAGTPPIAQAVGLAAAAQYLSAIGMDQISDHERDITAYALEGLRSLPGLTILGPDEAVDRGGAVSFTLDRPGRAADPPP